MKLEWKKITEKKFNAGFRKILKKTFTLPNGLTAEYDIRDEGRTGCVLALTSQNQVILEEIFRPGPEKVLLEMPGGFIGENEKPEEAIERELLEETGYKGKIELAGTVIDDAYSNCVRYCFVAKNCQKVQEPKWEEDEFIEIVEMSLEDFRKHLKSGMLTDVEAGYLALDHLNLL